MRLLLDAHVDPAVAVAMRERGHDVVSVLERGPEVYQAADDELLLLGAAEGRALVTRNIRDFVLLHARWAGREQSHAGIILVHARTIAEGDRGGEIRALDRLLRDHSGSTDLSDSLGWLEPAG